MENTDYKFEEGEKEMIINGVKKLVNKASDEKPAAVFFLDQSARPVSWLFREEWIRRREAGEIDTHIVMPQIRYINIGSEDRSKHKNPKLLADYKDKSKISPEGSILVVDEASDSGKSIKNAVEAVQSLYPNRIVTGHVAFEKLINWRDFNRGQALFGVRDPGDYAPGGESLSTIPARGEKSNRTARQFRKRLKRLLGE